MFPIKKILPTKLLSGFRGRIFYGSCLVAPVFEIFVLFYPDPSDNQVSYQDDANNSKDPIA